MLSRAADLAQLWGLDLRSLLVVATLALSYGVLKDIGPAVLTWIGITRRLPRRVGQTVRLVLLVVVAGALVYDLFTPVNLVRNSGFLEGRRFWGTGYLESMVTNGNFPAAALQIPLLLSRGAKAEWGLAVKDHRKAFFINHTSD